MHVAYILASAADIMAWYALASGRGGGVARRQAVARRARGAWGVVGG